MHADLTQARARSAEGAKGPIRRSRFGGIQRGAKRSAAGMG